MIEKTQWVYKFGGKHTQGNAEMRDLLGGKGANLAEMARLGLPIPPGFTITTDMCRIYYENDKQLPESLEEQVQNALDTMAQETGCVFGDDDNPLIVSVRSGSRASMPGMMDTVLNLGLNDINVHSLAKKSLDKRFAFDTYRRFIQMYSNVVLNVHSDCFEKILEEHREANGYYEDSDFTADNWHEIITLYKKIIREKTDHDFPQNPKDQLWRAIHAVFASWQNDRAIIYRRLNDVPNEWGTAVNVQSMVFGNMGNTSMTGVCFTRNPSTGEKHFYGEYLVNAQGEDVVAGIRTPHNISKAGREKQGDKRPSMEENMPDVYAELKSLMHRLETHYKDMQDIEFTVQKGTLYLLQTRSGKRTALAALNIAKDMYDENLISKNEALMRIAPNALKQLLHPRLHPDAKKELLAKALPASPGAVSGQIVLNAEDVVRLAADGQKAILVRVETSPEDIQGMNAAEGILTGRGGMTSHAAVVARGMGRTCVVGCSDMQIDFENMCVNFGNIQLKQGDYITLDGDNGLVLKGNLPTLPPDLSENFDWLMREVDKIRTVKVRTNAETPADTLIAKKFGAEGIGLCRTEHMFFSQERIIQMRQMILADNKEERCKALNALQPMQQQDFVEIFNIMEDLPVTIRLLDPPLHEFLPQNEAEIEALATISGHPIKHIKQRIEALHEFNPMLGHRGCRLAITFPEIYEMQVRAIFLAAIEVHRRTQKNITPEIMIPLVGLSEELSNLRKLVDTTAQSIFKQENIHLDYYVGTMIELPRAALCADELAQYADFLSFGTNDLTQTTFGISRDDAGSFLEYYQKNNIIKFDPFMTMDINGVGKLIEIACQKAKSVRPDIKLGICGEHGGDAASIEFCIKTGLDYVSCSPFRIPTAKLSATQTRIKHNM